MTEETAVTSSTESSTKNIAVHAATVVATIVVFKVGGYVSKKYTAARKAKKAAQTTEA